MTKDLDDQAGASGGVIECRSSAFESQAFEGGRAALTVEQVLAWADAYHATHGTWPRVGPGAVSRVVAGAHRELWKAINQALVLGLRGLPGDSSLAHLLAEHRGAPPPDRGPKAVAEKSWGWQHEQCPVKGPRMRLREGRERPAALTIAGILDWADAHHAATGHWPARSPAAVAAAPGDTWEKIDQALRCGERGLAGGGSLARLLARHRGLGNPLAVPGLNIEGILSWADAHHAATGNWPRKGSGPVRDLPREVTWELINESLRLGQYGLAGGSSLARLMAEYRDVRAPLTVERILAWADAYHADQGQWPGAQHKPVAGARGETWRGIDKALKVGSRGLPGGTSLTHLLVEYRGPEASLRPRRLSLGKIRRWADAHHAATGDWPTPAPSAVAEAPGETWETIDLALRQGQRGLPGGMTLENVIRPLKNSIILKTGGQAGP